MLSWAWAERLQSQGVAVHACHPGAVPGTGLANSLGLRPGIAPGGDLSPCAAASEPLRAACSVGCCDLRTRCPLDSPFSVIT